MNWNIWHDTTRREDSFFFARPWAWSFLDHESWIVMDLLMSHGCLWTSMYRINHLSSFRAIRFASNVALAVIMAILCSLRMTSDSEDEENELIQSMVRNMRHDHETWVLEKLELEYRSVAPGSLGSMVWGDEKRACHISLWFWSSCICHFHSEPYLVGSHPGIVAVMLSIWLRALVAHAARLDRAHCAPWVAHIAQVDVHMRVRPFIFDFCSFRQFYKIPIYALLDSDKSYHFSK